MVSDPTFGDEEYARAFYHPGDLPGLSWRGLVLARLPAAGPSLPRRPIPAAIQ